MEVFKNKNKARTQAVLKIPSLEKNKNRSMWNLFVE